MSTRIPTSPIHHSCACGRLLGIQIALRLIVKQRPARAIPGGGARIVCARCKRPSTFSNVSITRI